jgi:hypothetical protein
MPVGVKRLNVCKIGQSKARTDQQNRIGMQLNERDMRQIRAIIVFVLVHMRDAYKQAVETLNIFKKLD